MGALRDNKLVIIILYDINNCHYICDNIYKRLYPEDKEETRFNQEYFVISGGKRTRRKTGGKRTRRKRTRSRTKINY